MANCFLLKSWRPNATINSTYQRLIIDCQQPYMALVFNSNRSFGSDSDEVLTNDRLITLLLRLKNARSGDSFQVRVVTDADKADGKSTTEVMTLTQAVRKSLDMEKDLIEVDMKQDVPVLRIARYESILYRQAKKVADLKKKSNARPTKEVRFRTGIQENDLRRKAGKICDYLGKGHNCLVTIRASARKAAQDPDEADRTAKVILGIIDKAGDFIKEPSTNEERTQVQFLVRPASKPK